VRIVRSAAAGDDDDEDDWEEVMSELANPWDMPGTGGHTGWDHHCPKVVKLQQP
jgi:hypothetical protein